MKKAGNIKVWTYSGYKADERPVRFLYGEKELSVEELTDSWYGPDYTYFKVRASDGHNYILKNHHESDEWSIVYFSVQPEGR